MAEGALELRQGQSLVMTQQLRQSIQLLQLSTLDLNEFIDAEIEKNPLLAREEDRADYEDAEPQERDALSDTLDMQEGAIWGGNEDSPHYEHTRDGTHAHRHDSIAITDEMEQRIASRKSLHEEVMDQVRMNTSSLTEQKAAEYITDMIDAAGYLPMDAMARAAAIGIEEALFARVLSIIHQCEPTGVGARSLRECLALQLEEKGFLSRAMQLVLEHLEWMAQGKQKQLCKLCNVTPEQLMGLFAHIKACNPKPASGYDVSTPETLIPEVIIRRRNDGDYVVELNQDVLPKVLVDRDYMVRLKRGVRDKSESKAINEHMANAAWLTKALHQRSVTLIKVASEIVRQQQDFFDFGIHYLKPMTLKDVAAEALCHESTVSRITTQKYLACDRGVFEMKYFFTSTLQNGNGGSAYSSRSVMHLIKQMVDAEKASAVLSDDEIAERLNKQGIDVARRTVVKYRQQMDIPSSVQRRRSKQGRHVF